MERSTGIVEASAFDLPNIKLNQDRKKNVGASKYKSIIKKSVIIGNKSKTNVKKSTSEIKNNEPGKPKKIKEFKSMAIKSFGHNILIPLISDIRRVLKRLVTASTSRNELVDSRAWLINIQKLANNKFD